MRFIKLGSQGNSYYKGILEHAAFGLHKDIFELAKPYLNKNLKVLDFGCGEGSFSQRLVDEGLETDGCDLDIEQIKAGVKNKIKIDLNKNSFADNFSQTYDLVFAIEIIEHLENPWKTIRDATSVLKKGGRLVLSTPNVSNFISRLRFFMRGTLLAFEQSDLGHGHITPLPYFQLEYIFKCLHLKIVKRGYGGPVPLIHWVEFSRFGLWRNLLLPFLYPLLNGPKDGRALIYIVEKQD
jgi:2-polyprenyl-3-methyl-5-hydroxy-6-metoxy-1,4-benzoquinol methylase